MAQAFGVPVSRIYTIVFGVGAGAGRRGGGCSSSRSSRPTTSWGRTPLLLSFVVVILGGLGSLRGTLVAALLVGLSDGVISVLFSPTLAKIVATLLVALVLALRGRGLFGEATA